jgi:hypothetical protein
VKFNTPKGISWTIAGFRRSAAARPDDFQVALCKEGINPVANITTQFDGAATWGVLHRCPAPELALHLFHQGAGRSLVHWQIKENGHGLAATPPCLKAHLGRTLPPRKATGGVVVTLALAQVAATRG